MQTKNPKASVLVVTMMIMGIILISALSISLVSIQERKASISSNKSSQAYQIADSGIEAVMDKLVSANGSDKVSTLYTAAGVVRCDVVSGLIQNTATGYSVELKDASEAKIACDDNAKTISEVAHIKSVGTASGQAQRSIEAAVAAGDSRKICFVVTAASSFTSVSNSWKSIVAVPSDWTKEHCANLTDGETLTSGAEKMYGIGCFNTDGSYSKLMSGAKSGSYNLSATDISGTPSPNCGW